MTSTFVDTDAECAICLEPLSSAQSSILSCGHRFHRDCLTAQLQHARPHPGHRIILHGTQCAKCKQIVECPDLRDVITPVHELHQQIDRLIDTQLRVDDLLHHPDVLQEGIYQFGKRYYAFYLCAVCSTVYLGGTLDCGEQQHVLDRQAPTVERERLCDRCHVKSATTCTDPDHAPYFIWKCRYCCRVAQYVCYGSTHFCPHCHQANDRRERDGTPLRPTPCSCPGLTGNNRHKNGPSIDCEQVLHCRACESHPSTREVASKNFVYNGDAQHQLRGWVQVGTHWQVERSENASFSPKNFVSTFIWCDQLQVVDLQRYLRRCDLPIQISAKYMGRTDCPSVFQLGAYFLDRRFRKLTSAFSDIKECPPGYWETESLVLERNPNACYVVISVRGKDSRMWAGTYGAKVTAISARVCLDHANIRDEAQLILPDTPVGPPAREIERQALLSLHQASGSRRAPPPFGRSRSPFFY